MVRIRNRIVATLIMITLFIQSAIGYFCVEQVHASENSGVTVSTRDEFMQALTDGERFITVSSNISIGNEEDESGKMIPVTIPADVTIQGSSTDVSLDCRCPLQLAGDVTIRDIKLQFSSADVLNSVAHREIFLAGYSLTLDNVKTYLSGSDGSLGGLGGSEEELLPSVYAGGFEGTTVGNYASLTITNANSETMFQGIYMGHDAGTDSKAPYDGKATVTLCPLVTVRDGIYTDTNSSATISVSGKGNLNDIYFYGNDNTTLEITQTASNLNLYRSKIIGVGNVSVLNGANLQLAEVTIGNVTLDSDSCIDMTACTQPCVTGNWNGALENPGVLLLSKDGTLEIQGSVSGSTTFQIGNRNFPEDYNIDNHIYLYAGKNTNNTGFVLPESKQTAYSLNNNNGEWSVTERIYEDYDIASIAVTDAPTQIDINTLIGTEYIPAENAASCQITWTDTNGSTLSPEDVDRRELYYPYSVLVIRSEDWERTETTEATDWSNRIELTVDEENPGTYYFYIDVDKTDVKTGDYTFLLLSRPYEYEPQTVADVKALKESVLAKIKIHFYDSAITPPQESEPEPEPTTPVHVHSYTFVYGQATAVKNGYVHKKCVECGYVSAKKTVYRIKSIQLYNTKYNYNGKKRTPGVIITDIKGNVLKKNRDYTVSYASGRKNVGRYMVIIRMKGNYRGTSTRTFDILPKSTKISGIKAQKKGFTVWWKKQRTQTGGYQIQYSTKKNFSKKYTKTATVQSNKTTSKKISKLKAKKTYYVRIRTYKMVKINGKTKPIYSAWSSAKKVITKR